MSTIGKAKVLKVGRSYIVNLAKNHQSPRLRRRRIDENYFREEALRLGRRKEEQHADRLSREHRKRTVPRRRHVSDRRRRRAGLDAGAARHPDLAAGLSDAAALPSLYGS